MMCLRITIFCLFAFLVTVQSRTQSLPSSVDKDKVALFSLSDVRLLNSPFKQAQKTDKKYILSLDPHRCLPLF
jgi:hypothetical protein